MNSSQTDSCRKVKRRWRDLNSRAGYPTYRISSADPSATWVHLQKYRKTGKPVFPCKLCVIHFSKCLTKKQEDSYLRCMEKDSRSTLDRFSRISLPSASLINLSLNFLVSFSDLCLLGPPTQPPIQAIPSIKSVFRRPA